MERGVSSVEMIAEFFADKCIQRNIIDPSKREICKTGMHLILADIINFSLILLIGILTKQLSYAVIYLLLFWTVRRFCGGFHAKTYGVCRAVFVGTYILMFITSKLINGNWMLYALVCDAAALATMLLFAPVPHPNKELTDKERRANKLFSLLTTSFCTIVSIVLIAVGCKQGLVIALTLLAITILMYAGMLTNGKGRQITETQIPMDR